MAGISQDQIAMANEWLIQLPPLALEEFIQGSRSMTEWQRKYPEAHRELLVLQKSHLDLVARVEAGKVLVGLKSGETVNVSSLDQTSSSQGSELQRWAPYPTPLAVARSGPTGRQSTVEHSRPELHRTEDSLGKVQYGRWSVSGKSWFANRRSVQGDRPPPPGVDYTYRTQQADSSTQISLGQEKQVVASSNADSTPLITEKRTRKLLSHAETPKTLSVRSKPILRRQKRVSQGAINVQQDFKTESNSVPENSNESSDSLASKLTRHLQAMHQEVQSQISGSWVNSNSSQAATHGHDPVFGKSIEPTNVKIRAKKQNHEKKGKNETLRSKNQKDSQTDVGSDASVHRESLPIATESSGRADKSIGKGRRRKRVEVVHQTLEEFYDEEAALQLDFSPDSGDSEYEESEDEDTD